MKSLLAAMVVAGALVLGANTASAWDGGWGGCGGCGGCGFGGCGSFSRVRYTNVYRATSFVSDFNNFGGWGGRWF